MPEQTMSDPSASADSTSPAAERLDTGEPPDGVLVELRDIYKSFGPMKVLKGASIAVERGTSAVVMGGSGSGKSVLLKQIVQLLLPDSGEVWVKNKRVDQLDSDELDELRLSIGYLFQGGALFDSMTVFENMNFFLKRHTDLSKAERRERVEETLDWVNLRETQPKMPAELSGGQQKRVGLARSIILEPEIMLYDEPTTGLDPVSVRTVSNLIVRLRDERDITSISITHDLLCADIITDRAHFLHDGELIAHGDLENLRASDQPALRNFFGE